MGYRSTVAYTIRFVGDDDTKAKQSFYTFIAEAKAKEKTALCFSEEEAEYLKVDEKKLSLYFFADHVKWYESYAGVACHEALMQLSKDWVDDSENDCIGGVFARIGEDMEDNIEECWGQGDYQWISVNRYMYCDWLE